VVGRSTNRFFPRYYDERVGPLRTVALDFWRNEYQGELPKLTAEERWYVWEWLEADEFPEPKR